MGHYAYDGEEYCENCGPIQIPDRKLERSFVHEFDHGETDSPSHCGLCQAPLDYSLTVDGVAYVVEKLKEELQTSGPAAWNEIRETVGKTYYSGSRAIT